jgi:hypothetical protein
VRVQNMHGSRLYTKHTTKLKAVNNPEKDQN